MGPIVGALASGAPAAANLVGSVADKTANSAHAESTDTATTNVAPAVTGEQQKQNIESAPQTAEAAGQAAEGAANYYKQNVLPGVQQAVQGNQGSAQLGQQMAGNAFDEWQNAVKDTNSKMTDAEYAMGTAANNATIDPNAYLHTLGVPEKVASSIGMVLSGVGSGLTGQSNLAMDVFQKRTQQAIDAQQQTFHNKMQVAAGQAGLLKTDQDRQTVQQAATFGAQMSVLQGNNAAIDALMAKGKTGTMEAQAKMLKLDIQQKLADVQQKFNEFYANRISSGNKKDANLLGAITVPIINHFAPETSNRYLPSEQTPQQRLQPAKQTSEQQMNQKYLGGPGK